MNKNYILLSLIIFSLSACVDDNKGKNIDKKEIEVSLEVNYDGKLNDSRVRLRDEPNLNSNTLGYLDINNEVKILNKSKEKELIENMYSYWYQIKTTSGDEGWMYGYFLDINENSSYYINNKTPTFKIKGTAQSRENLENLINYNIKKIKYDKESVIPEIESKIDSEAYNRLAGIYIDENPDNINFITYSKIQCSWGDDYTFGRRACITIDYDDNKWIIGEGGGAYYFNIISIENDDIQIKLETSNPEITKVQLDDKYITWGNRKLYKLSGPNLPLMYLKKAEIKRSNQMKKNKIIQSVDAEEIIGNLPYEIYSLLRKNAGNKLIPYISNKYGLNYMPEYLGTINKENIKEDNEEYLKFISSKGFWIRSNSDMKLAVPFYNEFMIIDIEEIIHKYPNPIVVEFYYSQYSSIGFVFISENNEWKLVCIVDHLDYV